MPPSTIFTLIAETMMQARRRPRHSAPSTGTPTDEPRIVQHPDGYYWCSEEHEVGPFTSFDDARADLQSAELSEMDPAPVETIEQVEDDIGVESWIDPDTGSLAEEQRPRIEEH
jgi:hypothetical protein